MKAHGQGHRRRPAGIALLAYSGEFAGYAWSRQRSYLTLRRIKHDVALRTAAALASIREILLQRHRNGQQFSDAVSSCFHKSAWPLTGKGRSYRWSAIFKRQGVPAQTSPRACVRGRGLGGMDVGQRRSGSYGKERQST